jgi:periplasmic protein TonB
MATSIAPAGMLQPLAQDRALLWCVLASIALHALVLLGMSRQEAPAPPSRSLLVLTARLAPFAAAPQAPPQMPPPERAQPQPAEPAIRPALTKPLASPAPAAPKTAPAEPVKAAPAATPPGPADSTAQPAAPVQARPLPQAPAATSAAETAAKSGNEADAGTLDQYRLALIVATRRYKRYPAIAMEKGWQGRVEVQMVIGANGMIASASIKTSSGHEILDNQALDMLKKGKTTVSIPVSLRGREFSIVVPVVFNLDNPNT